jgi:hypothetical protein
MNQLEKYVIFPYEDQIWQTYAHLVNNSYNLKSPGFPFIGELLERCHDEINLKARSEKVNEMVAAGIHLKYGYAPHVFHSKAAMGGISEFTFQEMQKSETDSIVLNYLRTRYMSYTGADRKKVINCPYGGGIW